MTGTAEGYTSVRRTQPSGLTLLPRQRANRLQVSVHPSASASRRSRGVTRVARTNVRLHMGDDVHVLDILEGQRRSRSPFPTVPCLSRKFL